MTYIGNRKWNEGIWQATLQRNTLCDFCHIVNACTYNTLALSIEWHEGK